MIRRVLVDCDVVLDLLLGREPHLPATIDLFMLFQEGRVEGSVSSLLFSNVFYVLRETRPAPDAINALRKLRVIVRVLPVNDQVVELALSSSFADFEDALHYYTAVTHELDAIVTRNKRDYKSSKIPIFSAEECLQVVRVVAEGK
jgi:predicted nucleic acid-binding protein